MNESKEYVSQPVENGSIRISEDVIASIASMAALEVEGVYGLNNMISAELAGKIGKKSPGRGIRLTIAENNEISIDCYVVVLYGHSVFDVAKNVQENVTTVVESTTGQKVKSVNVSISGISLPKESKKQ
jgi:uncharacterized alkaline shock family protein YloU